jgi:transposase
LIPTLTIGKTIVIDNASFHQSQKIKALIESAGCKLVYLPPYSPDLNPIELFWSKVKHTIRKKSARTFHVLSEAISEAFQSVNSTDLFGWFEHCGYRIN